MPRLTPFALSVVLLVCGCSPREQQQQQSAPETFVATGHEPGWRLDIAHGRLRLLADYGEIEITAPAPAPEAIDGGRRYAASGGGHEILVTVADTTCGDGATGWPWPSTVTLVLDGRTLNGCGGPTPPPRESELPDQR